MRPFGLMTKLLGICTLRRCTVVTERGEWAGLACVETKKAVAIQDKATIDALDELINYKDLPSIGKLPPRYELLEYPLLYNRGASPLKKA